MLLGGHGDTMVPLPRYTSIGGKALPSMLSEQRINEIVERTKKGGGEIVGLMGTSAWYAPGAAAAQMVEAIVKAPPRISLARPWAPGRSAATDLLYRVPAHSGRAGRGGAGGQHGRYGGGIEHFPRFLENWRGRTVTCVSALVSVHESVKPTGTWNIGNSCWPPTRDWSFDVRFEEAENLPPGTPVVGNIIHTAFRPVY